jgi:hypothetical protein
MTVRTDVREKAGERIAEIGEILALGLVRLNARKSSEVLGATGESSLACVADQSGHANSETGEMG